MARHLAPTTPPVSVAAPQEAWIARTRAGIAARLRSSPAGPLLTPYFQAGKMLRGRLLFATATAVGACAADVQAAAEAIELLHGASLLHDDIIDGAATRRGLPAVHERLGAGAALVLGDDLLLMAFAALGDCRACYGADRVLAATDVLTRCARACCRGQFQELTAQEQQVDEARYLAIVRGKTSAQFVAAAAIGALLADAPGEARARLEQCAEQMGIAFQIGDDLLDLLGDAGAIGKPTGNSLAQGRPSLPLILLARLDPAGAASALAAARAGESGALEALVAQLEHHGIFARVHRVQQHCVRKALAALADLPAGEGLEVLRWLAAGAGTPGPGGAAGSASLPTGPVTPLAPGHAYGRAHG